MIEKLEYKSLVSNHPQMMDAMFKTQAKLNELIDEVNKINQRLNIIQPAKSIEEIKKNLNLRND